MTWNPRWPTRRHRRAAPPAVGVALVLVLGACAGDSAGSDEPAVPGSARAATEFLDDLEQPQRDAVQFDWTDTAQKQRWSNLPTGMYSRQGLEWGQLSDGQQDAWLELMAASLSEEGFNRIRAIWAADEANAAETGWAHMYGQDHYAVAVIGNPSETEPWMWQFGGNHLAVNATVAGGRVSITPSFLGVQPATYPDEDGNLVRPLGDIQDEASALVGSLDETQKQTAVRGAAPLNLLTGPGEDGTTVPPDGIPLSGLDPDQQAAALRLIGHYTGLVDEADAAVRLDDIRAAMDQTRFAWYGPITPGQPGYFRVTGPTIVIEFAPQESGTTDGEQPSGGGTGAGTGPGSEITVASSDHVHSVYRDPTNEYGARYTG